MASLLSLISDLLPMVIPASTRITRAKQLEPAHPTVEGPVIHRDAVVNKSDKMCVSVLTTRPYSDSTVRHNGEQEAIIYVVSGAGILAVNEGVGREIKNHQLASGDFAFLPAWTEHQFKNPTGEDVVWHITQSGPVPIIADLTDWSGDVVRSRN